MKRNIAFAQMGTWVTAASLVVCAITSLAQSQDLHFGHMKANKILFLGNSLTIVPGPQPAIGWEGNWGMDASSPEKDYVHLLTTSIETRTGGSLRIDPTEPLLIDGLPANDPYVIGDANIVNIADVFERGYATYNASQLQQQLAWQADIVVLQFGENISAFNATTFKHSLRTLLTDLKGSSNPNIFMTSYTLYPNEVVDNIKQELCEEDPTHRVFVDMSGFRLNPANLGGFGGHPSDAGMAFIADTLYTAMDAHNVPEPGSAALLGSLLAGLLTYVSRNRVWR